MSADKRLVIAVLRHLAGRTEHSIGISGGDTCDTCPINTWDVELPNGESCGDDCPGYILKQAADLLESLEPDYGITEKEDEIIRELRKGMWMQVVESEPSENRFNCTPSTLGNDAADLLEHLAKDNARLTVENDQLRRKIRPENRLLSMKEANDLTDIVWVEIRGKSHIVAADVEFSGMLWHKGSLMCKLHTIGKGNPYCLRADFCGIDWRIWLEKPTPEEMTAATWANMTGANEVKE